MGRVFEQALARDNADNRRLIQTLIDGFKSLGIEVKGGALQLTEEQSEKIRAAVREILDKKKSDTIE